MPAAAWLALAIIAEVIATSLLKASAAFTRPLPSLVVVAGYAAAFYCLSLALRSMPVGIAYAIWSGIGIVLVTAIAWVVYGQKLDAVALADHRRRRHSRSPRRSWVSNLARRIHSIMTASNPTASPLISWPMRHSKSSKSVAPDTHLRSVWRGMTLCQRPRPWSRTGNTRLIFSPLP